MSTTTEVNIADKAKSISLNSLNDRMEQLEKTVIGVEENHRHGHNIISNTNSLQKRIATAKEMIQSVESKIDGFKCFLAEYRRNKDDIHSVFYSRLSSINSSKQRHFTAIQKSIINASATNFKNEIIPALKELQTCMNTFESKSSRSTDWIIDTDLKSRLSLCEATNEVHVLETLEIHNRVEKLLKTYNELINNLSIIFLSK